ADPALRRTLQTPAVNRRHLLRGALAIAGVGLGVHLLGRPGMPLELGADLRSGTGERLAETPPDGSQLLLDACSAVDLRFDAYSRELLLRRGKLLVQAAQGSLPFIVRTPAGSVQTPGARFMVALQDQASRVWVQEASVRIDTLNGA